ncbi:MAG: UDP-N-acetylmuramate--L-alanine ligase [Clostridia bacterium]|nr:UDP-N-acetylmuramate--L-alanine ligase [Clostridia bacterium]
MSVENTHYGAACIADILSGASSLYFIGIGGINMSSLAHISHIRGFRVGGSDQMQTALTDRLTDAGIEIFYSHEASHIEGYDAIVYTVAIAPDNPEYTAALARGIPCISRADFLGYIMTGYRNRVGVSGMHGKSTCTSMCALSFMHAGGDPTVLSGATLAEMGGAYRIGCEDHFIFEACEYMDSFLDFNPNIAIILNIELDHVDYFKSITQVRRSFSDYAAITGTDGYAVVNGDDDNVRLAMAGYAGTLVTFGLSEGCDYTANNIEYISGMASFDVYFRGEYAAHINLSVPGRHNVYNALAAFAAAMICGLDPDTVAEGLSHYLGAGRRMEYKGKWNEVDVYDDYAHHPTEIAVTLGGFRDMGFGRLFCIYQPHTYSRTAALWDDFVSALSTADRVLMVDIYAAREKDTLGVSSSLLAQAIGDKADYCASFDDAIAILSAEAQPGDAIIVMGAGTVYRIFPLLGL